MLQNVKGDLTKFLYEAKIKKDYKLKQKKRGERMSVAVHVNADKMLIAMAKKQYNCAGLAKASGVSRTTISYIRNGKSCKPDVAGKLATALGLSVEELIVTKKEQTQ